MELQLTEDSKKVMREILEKKDTNGNGKIDKKEFKECLSVLGFNATPDEIVFLMEKFDTNNDGDLVIDEIMDNLDVINAHSLHGNDLVEAFKKFDPNESGYIQGYELQQILTKPGPDQMSREEATEIIEELRVKFDKNGDGRFSYPEFVRIVMQTNYLDGDTF